MENGKEYQVNGSSTTATAVVVTPSVVESAVAAKPIFTSADMKVMIKYNLFVYQRYSVNFPNWYYIMVPQLGNKP